jgi:hypothetical protein
VPEPTPARKPARAKPRPKAKPKAELVPKITVTVDKVETVQTAHGRVPAGERFETFIETFERTEDCETALEESGLSVVQVIDYRARCPEFDARCRRMQKVFTFRAEMLLQRQVKSGDIEPKLLVFFLEHLHPDFRKSGTVNVKVKATKTMRLLVSDTKTLARMKEIYEEFGESSNTESGTEWRNRRYN